MESNEVKEYIVKKFGNVSRFARITNHDISDFHNKFKRDENLQEIFDLAKSTKNKVIKNQELTLCLRNDIRVKIYTNYKNVLGFCKEHPEFSNNWISNVINGKTGGYKRERKLITKKVRKLLKTLKIEIK